MEEYLYKNETGKIISAIFEVHNQLGSGFLEQVYQEALMYELISRKIPSIKEKRLDIYYKKRKLDKYYIADFICFKKIIVELKATEDLCDEDVAQVLNYLKATNFELGLLVNFGTTKAQVRRIIL